MGRRFQDRSVDDAVKRLRDRLDPSGAREFVNDGQHRREVIPVNIVDPVDVDRTDSPVFTHRLNDDISSLDDEQGMFVTCQLSIRPDEDRAFRFPPVVADHERCTASVTLHAPLLPHDREPFVRYFNADRFSLECLLHYSIPPHMRFVPSLKR